MYTLPQFIFLFPHDFILYEQEGEEGRNEVIKGPYHCHYIVSIDVFVLAYGKRSMAVMNLLDSMIDIRIFYIAEQGIID